MSPAAVQTVFQAVIVSKLTYAAPAWIGFSTKDELDRLDSFLTKSARFSFAPPDQKSFRELVEVQEEKLFQTIISNPDHILYKLLPLRDKLPIICDNELMTSLYLQDKQN